MSEWFVNKGSKVHGPFSPSQLKQLAESAKIDGETQVRVGSDGKWTLAKNVRGLFSYTAAPVAQPAVAMASARVSPPPLPLAKPPRPVASAVAAPVQPVVLNDRSSGERELLTVHPSMFRNQPVRFCLFVFLIFVGFVILILGFLLGASPNDYALGFLLMCVFGLLLLLWWLRYRKVSLTVTDKRTILRFGLLSRYVKEVRHSDVRMLVISQGFLQRLLGVGAIAVASAATGESDISVSGIPHPEQVKKLIDDLRP
jgi:membrane protein YdbS with pleckstrin-like domain